MKSFSRKAGRDRRGARRVVAGGTATVRLLAGAIAFFSATFGAGVSCAQVSTAKQSSSAKPSNTAKQSSSAKPSNTAKQSSSAKPSNTAKQSSSAKPSNTAKQSPSAKPSTTAKQSSSAKPSNTAKQGPASKPATVPATPSTSKGESRWIEFGWIGRIGPKGRGTVTNGLEVLRENRTGLERKIELLSYRDLLVEIRQDLRVVDKKTVIDVIDDWSEYRMTPDKIRSVTVTLDGKQVSHLNQGPLGPRQSQGIPARMEDPLVLDDDLIPGYQLLIERLLSRETETQGWDRLEKLARGPFQVISPGRLTTYDYRIEAVGRETLTFGDQSVETAKVDIIRQAKAFGERTRDPALDFKRTFWLTVDGEIVRFETPEQRRHQGSMSGYNLKYRPGHAGFYAQKIMLPQPNRQGVEAFVHTSDVRSQVLNDSKVEARPTVVLLHDDTEASRRIAHSLRWRWVPKGINMFSVGMPASDQVGALAQIRQRLDQRAALDSNAVLISVGTISADLVRALAETSWRGWATVNGVCPSYPAESASAIEFPVGAFWSGGGERAVDRSDWGKWIVSKNKIKGTASDDPAADDSFRNAAAGDRFGVSMKLLEQLESWSRERWKP